MSDPGMTPPGAGMTYEQYQHLQDMQKRKALGAALMSGNAQGANGGLANAGNALLGAMIVGNNQGQNDPAAQAMMARGQVQSPQQAAAVLHPSLANRAGNYFSNLFNLGGGN